MLEMMLAASARRLLVRSMGMKGGASTDALTEECEHAALRVSSRLQR